MESKVARDVRRAQFARFAAMTAAERVEMASRLGEDDVLSCMSNHGVDRRTALSRIKEAHRAGRRHSACAVDGDR